MIAKIENRVAYSVVKNNKTPNGPISVGDVKFSIINKAASPIMLQITINRLCFITSLYHNWLVPPSIYVKFCMEEGGGYPALINITIDRNPDPPISSFDRFTLSEALSLLVFFFRSCLCCEKVLTKDLLMRSTLKHLAEL